VPTKTLCKGCFFVSNPIWIIRMRVLINSNFWHNSLSKKYKITFVVNIHDFEGLFNP